MIERARSFLDRGYTAKALYTDIPTEEAMTARPSGRRRRRTRATGGTSPRSSCARFTATWPRPCRTWSGGCARRTSTSEIEIYDNHQGKDEEGNFRPPLRFFSYKDGVETVENAELWQAFQNKAFEEIIVPERKRLRERPRAI